MTTDATTTDVTATYQHEEQQRGTHPPQLAL
jgi:hypothetical protein